MCPVDLKTPYDRPDLVKNCDDSRSLNLSPDVLEAKKQLTADKPAILLPKPVIEAPTRTAITATVGLKKKLSDNRKASKAVAEMQKRFEKTPSIKPKNSPVTSNSTFAGKR